jgi:anti-sigma regulatory factor (Ser/Thr protein kinase)
LTRSRRFRCRPEAVPAARRFVREALNGRPSELVAAVELMSSELATNCVVHARTDFELAVHAGAEIRVEVHDTSTGGATPRNPTPHEPTGRGLRIVEAMSSAWGVVPSAAGKTVWFTVRRAPDEHGR